MSAADLTTVYTSPDCGMVHTAGSAPSIEITPVPGRPGVFVAPKRLYAAWYNEAIHHGIDRPPPRGRSTVLLDGRLVRFDFEIIDAVGPGYWARIVVRTPADDAAEQCKEAIREARIAGYRAAIAWQTAEIAYDKREIVGATLRDAARVAAKRARVRVCGGSRRRRRRARRPVHAALEIPS